VAFDETTVFAQGCFSRLGAEAACLSVVAPDAPVVVIALIVKGKQIYA
jgi:hypothetical protein